MKNKNLSNNPNTLEETKFLSDITNDQNNAEGSRSDIERIWEDEYLMYKGDQWSTSIAPRSAKAKKIRPNSVNNFILSNIINKTFTLTATTPESTVEIVDEDDNIPAEDQKALEEKLSDVLKAIKYKNNYPSVWKKIVLQGVSHGPFIGAVIWDNDWVGGSGPNRWIGEARILNIKKQEFYPDPAIVDLEERLQECAFIHRKIRKKLSYFIERFGEKGYYVTPDEDTVNEEGSEPNQATLFERWHKGRPRFVPEEWKKYFLAKAQEAETGNFALATPVYPDPYKAERFRAMAKGELDGVHVAYATRDVFLEYIPYVYDDGKYPFAFKVVYYDEKCPYGFGEIRNITVPQILHNKADEIEIEAMAKEGLGGARYSKGAISEPQLDNIVKNSGKGGMYFEVNDIHGIQDRTGVKVPATIQQYKEHKQRMCETISQNTPIQQGMSPTSNAPYRLVRELGARADLRTKGIAEILEDFQKEIDHLILSRIAQFYDETRKYKVPAEDGSSKRGAFSNTEMKRRWEREPAMMDGEGNEIPAKMEEYIPELDVKVKVLDERPTEREYYIEFALELYNKEALDIESLWYTIEEGKFPPKDDILERLQAGQGPFDQYSAQMQEMLVEMLQTDPQAVLQIVQNQVPEEEILAMLEGQQAIPGTIPGA
jgi:hypothetical protein